MVRIRKDKGGSGIGPYWWPEDDPVCEVDEALARDLLAHPDWGYSLEPDLEPEEPESGDDGEDPDDGGEEEEPPDTGGQGDGSENADGQGEEKKPPAKPAARRSRAKGATA